VADRGKIVDCEISPTMGKQIDLTSIPTSNQDGRQAKNRKKGG
jgi:hypothetical protein